MIDFLSLSHLLLALALTGLLVLRPIRERHQWLAGANVVIGFLLLGQSFFLMAALATINFFGIRYFQASQIKLNSRARILFHALWIMNLTPLLLLRSTFQFEWKSLVLSFSLCFFCLQQIGALIDLYNRRFEPPQSFLHWLSFALFFPSIVAGPIGRWGEMRDQLLSPQIFETRRAVEGLLLCAQGIFKKMVFAVPFLLVTERFLKAPLTVGPLIAFAVAFLFRYGIWADVSAHTDWARGISSFLGLELRPNYDRPFQTTRLADFWRRWHMSLSTWLQDYIFLPLAFGPLRRRWPKTLVVVLAVLAAFAVLGLWHGLTITLLIMGLYKGAGVLISEWFERRAGARLGFFLRAVIGAAFMILFMVVPTLLIGLSLDDFFSLVRQGFDFSTFGTSKLLAGWQSLTLQTDGFQKTSEPIAVLIGLAFGWEILQFSGRSAATDPRAQIAFAEGHWLSPSKRILLIALLFVIWLLFASFTSALGFAYVRI